MRRRELVRLLLSSFGLSAAKLESAQDIAVTDKDQQLVLDGAILQTASQNLEEAAYAAVAALKEEVDALERTIHDLSLAFGELIKADIVNAQIRSYATYIERSERAAFRRTLMRAIIFEEQVHEFPPFFESILESWGYGDSVGPSQIRVSKWATVYSTDRQRLLDPETHIPVMAAHLDYIMREISRRQLPTSAEWVGTLWNHFVASEISDYGVRVGNYYKRFASVGAAAIDEGRASSVVSAPRSSQDEPSEQVSRVRTPSAGQSWERMTLTESPPWNGRKPGDPSDWSSALHQSSALEREVNQRPVLGGIDDLLHSLAEERERLEEATKQRERDEEKRRERQDEEWNRAWRSLMQSMATSRGGSGRAPRHSTAVTPGSEPGLIRP